MGPFPLGATNMRCRLNRRKAAISLLPCMAAAALIFSNLQHFDLPPSFSWQPSPCACLKCLRDGDGPLEELINRAPQPFLTANSTTQDDFNWWKGLQREKRDFSLYNETLHKLFQIIPPFPDVGGARRDSCRSCAVVGNSGKLTDSFYGPLIDHHDIVIRMNRARTKGFEKDVGTKTTHHVFYPESSTTLDDTTQLLFFPFKIFDLLWLLNKLSPPGSLARIAKRMANKDLVKMLNPAFMRYVHESWLEKKGFYPSTGFLVVALSMQMCDEVDVFGFGADKDGNWNHYFEKMRNPRIRTGPHAGKYEYEVIQQLSEKKKIQFF